MSARILQLGRGLQSRLKDIFDTPLDASATPLELLQATLDELERKIQPAGRGRRIFPYDRVVVRVARPETERPAIDAVFQQLESRLRDRLQELKCEAPERIDARVSVVDATGDTHQPLLDIECSQEGSAEPSTAVVAPPRTVRITVVKGQCTEAEYAFEEPVISIGRTQEPTDAFGQVRYNHVVFLETRDGVNETVGRAHAKLQIDEESGQYHLFNEGSSNPTSIIRAGKMIHVAPRDPRGIRIQSGDHLHLGRAVLRVTLE